MNGIGPQMSCEIVRGKKCPFAEVVRGYFCDGYRGDGGRHILNNRLEGECGERSSFLESFLAGYTISMLQDKLADVKEMF